MTATATAPKPKLAFKAPKEAAPSRPKILLFGRPGVGKTWLALDFPNVAYMDTEGGADLKHYTDKLEAAGGQYVGPSDGTLDAKFVLNQIRALATEPHEFKTLVIDSITKLYNHIIAIEAERLGDKNAFGADKKPAIAFMRSLVSWINRLDMNVVFIAHEKTEWGVLSNGERGEIGKGPDVYDKIVYELDLCFQVVKRGPQRTASVKKSRLIGFPEGESFELDYKQFADRYGVDVIEKAGKVLVLATAEQVAEIRRLVDLLKLDATVTDKWLEKANAEKFEEFNTAQAAKIVESLKSKIK